jgi:hypothetical protein
MSFIDSYFKIVQLTKDVKALNKIRGKAKEIESKKLTSLQQNVNDGKEGKSAISIETSKLETSK